MLGVLGMVEVEGRRGVVFWGAAFPHPAPRWPPLGSLGLSGSRNTPFLCRGSWSKRRPPLIFANPRALRTYPACGMFPMLLEIRSITVAGAGQGQRVFTSTPLRRPRSNGAGACVLP